MNTCLSASEARRCWKRCSSPTRKGDSLCKWWLKLETLIQEDKLCRFMVLVSQIACQLHAIHESTPTRVSQERSKVPLFLSPVSSELLLSREPSSRLFWAYHSHLSPDMACSTQQTVCCHLFDQSMNLSGNHAKEMWFPACWT